MDLCPLGSDVHTFFLYLGSGEENISFSAYLLSDGYVDVPRGSVVVYDQVMANHGNAYNKFSGIFTVPKAGTYFFAMYYMSTHQKDSALGIYINNEVQCTSYGYEYSVGTCPIIKDLKIGDIVNVKARYEHYVNGAQLYGSAQSGYKHANGFVGYLLKAT